MKKATSKQSLKVGDKVTIKGTVVSVEGTAVTIEISDAKGERKHNVTLNDSQVTDAVSK